MVQKIKWFRFVSSPKLLKLDQFEFEITEIALEKALRPGIKYRAVFVVLLGIGFKMLILQSSNWPIQQMASSLSKLNQVLSNV